ncbi:uncharacterized protein LOC114282202 [Camellia sinensis]|uniref:uncharacterized protein LOC114282202 n=1 Tax=Camellia sinensis TaxID=4442 RepID=UPI001035FA6B|nr:uncharacterized protein LOC114282202 [Camellia sinensis]
MVTMLEKIRLLLIETVQKRRDAMQRHNGPICPKIQDHLEKMKVDASGWIPRWNGNEQFEVVGPYGERHKLDLQSWTCGCTEWDLSNIPCAHVVAATNFLGQELEKYVHQYYKVETYLKIYVNMLTPINGREMWPRTEYAKVLPPDVKKRVGRPKQNKRKETEAPIQGIKLGRQGTKMTCNNCGKVGHNRRSCKLKGRFSYMQESQPQGSQTKPSQPQSQLTAEAPEVKRHMRQKKLAIS